MMGEFNGLEFFKQVYGQVPEWVSKMHHFSPKALEYYTKLRGEILVDGKLSKKDKELILVGVNAARRYERSMIYHTKGAIESGATVDEIADIIATCIISRGIPAWLTGIKAIQYAIHDLQGKHSEEIQEEKNLSFRSLEECLRYYEAETGRMPEWVHLLKEHNPDVLYQYSNLRNHVLTDRYASRKLKELVLVGINVCEMYKEGIQIHVNNAKKLGATDEEIAEVSLVGLLTAGIPAWFEGSDFL
jgi:alkylhydroperoxidase/carboxymuconolactone decarboxylase family protein YurZ